MKHRKLFPDPDAANSTSACLYNICDPACPYNEACYPNNYFPTTPPPPAPIHHKHSVSPYVIIFVSFVVCFFIFIYICLVITNIRERENNSSQQGQQNDADEEFLDENRIDHPIWLIATAGLHQSVINSISVCKYKKGEGLIEGTDCSVCLNEFQDDETVRLLPKCNHAFHVSCIDAWLRSHINCPLCRACIVSPQTVTAAPLAAVDQSLADDTNVENAEIGLESGENQERNREASENRTGTEESEIALVGSETILKDSVSFKRNDGSQVVGDNDIPVVENDIQSLRRSVSLDSSLAETICFGLADFSSAESGDYLFDEIKEAEKSRLAAVLTQGGAYSRWSRVTGSSSIGQSLHKGPVSMKRSFSCSGRFFSSRRNRSLNAILPL